MENFDLIRMNETGLCHEKINYKLFGLGLRSMIAKSLVAVLGVLMCP